MDAPRKPPIGLNAALDIAISLPRAASEDEGERALGLRMAGLTLDRCAAVCEGDPAHEAYLAELLPRLWASSHVLIKGRRESLRELEEAEATYAKSREALDRLAGIGGLGLNGWMARLGALVAGFSIPQLLDEFTEQEERVALVVGRGGVLARHVEALLVQELSEPLFGELVLVSLVAGVLAAWVAGRVLKRYRLRSIERLQADVEAAEVEAAERVRVRHRAALSALLATLANVMERHYPGAAAAEVRATTGLDIDTADLLAGRGEDALDALLAQHLGV